MGAAIEAIKSDEAEVMIIDLLPPDKVQEWWDDEGFVSSPFTKNAQHAGIVATAMTVGQLQRETKDRDIQWEGMYAHNCQACARLYQDPKIAKVIRKHHEEVVHHVISTAWIDDVMAPQVVNAALGFAEISRKSL